MVEHAEVAAHRIFLESKIKSIAMQKEVIKRLRDRIEKHTEEALAFEEELQQKKWLVELEELSLASFKDVHLHDNLKE